MRTCRICQCKYQPIRPMQPTCSAYDCQLAYAQAVALKAAAKRQADERKAIRVKRKEIKTRSDWMREAQAAINRWVLARDAGKPCISCGRHHSGRLHAGHYLSRGAHPELAYEPYNIHLQCAPCNVYLSGNQANYRKGLIERIGIDLVEWLECKRAPTKHSIDALKAIRDEYRAKLREMKRGA